MLYLTHENHQLREQNELLRQMLIGRLPASAAAAVSAAMAQQERARAEDGAEGASADAASPVTVELVSPSLSLV